MSPSDGARSKNIVKVSTCGPTHLFSRNTSSKLCENFAKLAHFRVMRARVVPLALDSNSPKPFGAHTAGMPGGGLFPSCLPNSRLNSKALLIRTTPTACDNCAFRVIVSKHSSPRYAITMQPSPAFPHTPLPVRLFSSKRSGASHNKPDALSRGTAQWFHTAGTVSTGFRPSISKKYFFDLPNQDVNTSIFARDKSAR